jgi:hypothetical protein
LFGTFTKILTKLMFLRICEDLSGSVRISEDL